MIKYESLEQQAGFLNRQNVGSYQNYLDEILFPAIKRGDLTELETLVVLRGSNGEDVYFKDDVWAIHLAGASEGELNIYFTHTTTPHCNLQGLGRKLERNICKELKCLTVCMMYKGRERGITTMLKCIGFLKSLAFIMLDKGFNSFEQLTLAMLRQWATESTLFSITRALSAFNMAIDYCDYLPFEVGYGKLNLKTLGVRSLPEEQHLVIPPRVFTQIVNQYTKEINELVPLLNELENVIEEVVLLEQRMVKLVIEQLRSGKREVAKAITKKSQHKLLAAFERAGIEIADNFRSADWEDIFVEQKPGICSSWNYYHIWKKEPFIVGKRHFESVGQLKMYMREIDAKCKAICLALSGMRSDELHAMHPLYGAQTEDIQGQTIHLFTTLQSKITQSSQSKKDIFVTTKNAHNAFRVLNTIHAPLRKRFKTNKQKLFAALSQTFYPYAVYKVVWMSNLRTFLNSDRSGCRLELNADDMKYLSLSNPEQTSVSDGSRFKFTLHQFRRSFAYYLIGFELMAFPQLKSQLSHLSSAMTRHYANNASDFHKLYREINVERTRQQSEIMARVYQKIANNERIAGGKGKALKQIAGDGKNYFEKDDNKRKLEPGYWAQLIEQGKEHLHAIAPAMYCTNSACSMRINIDLAECVDCEHDIIENAMYAEGVRINASKNLLILEETGELTHSVMSQLAMKIRAAEKILADLNYDFEPFQFPQSVLDAQIGVVNLPVEAT